MPTRLLLVDARPRQREALELALNTTDWTLAFAEDARAALAMLERDRTHVAICDPEMPGLDDFELVPQLQRAAPSLQVLLSIESSSAERFETATRLGADGLLAHPIEPAELHLALQGAMRRIDRERRIHLLERDLAQAVGDKPIVGASEPMIGLLEKMERAAGFKTPVLIQGERGTHREVLARAIHAQSLRRTAPFVAVRCAAHSGDEVEKRLYDGPGKRQEPHAVADALAAEGGTLFLDEVSALSDAAQSRLLHLLEHEEVVDPDTQKARPVDVRVIVATHTDLGSDIGQKAVLPGLRARLDSVVLEVPALRERPEDIPLLVDHVVARLRSELALEVDGVSDSAMNRLRHYEWPGNLRELENVIERAMLLATTDRVTIHELPTMISTASADGESAPGGDFSLRRARRSFEAEMIRRALGRTDGNRTRAAKLLEISHRALLYKIKEFGLRD